MDQHNIKDAEDEQFGAYRSNLASIRNLPNAFNEDQFQLPYRNLDESDFIFPTTRQRTKSSRAINDPRSKNSFVDFIKDDEYDDFDKGTMLKPKPDDKTKANDKTKTNDKSNDKSTDAQDSSRATKANGDDKQSKNETDLNDEQMMNFGDINFDNFEFKLDDEDEKANRKFYEMIYRQNRTRPKQEEGALKQDIIMSKDKLPSTNPIYVSKVVYSKEDLITEDQNHKTGDQKDSKRVNEKELNSEEKNNSADKITSIALPKTTDFVDEPSGEPRIRKLRRLRKLGRIRRPNNSTGHQRTEHQSQANRIDKELTDDGQQDEEIRKKLDMNKFGRQQNMGVNGANLKVSGYKYLQVENDQTDKKPTRIIRVVKVVKTNAAPNITVINEEIKSGSRSASSNDDVKNTLKNASDEILNKLANNPPINLSNKLSFPKVISLPATKQNETKKIDLKNKNVDDYIDEFDDVETTKKNRIKHVLY